MDWRPVLLRREREIEREMQEMHAKGGDMHDRDRRPGMVGCAVPHEEIAQQDVGPIRDSLSEVKMALMALSGSIDRLRAKSIPAMAQGNECKAGASPVRKCVGNSPICLAIEDLAAMARELNTEVISIIDGIEL
jgi:hypothetical protein